MFAVQQQADARRNRVLELAGQLGVSLVNEQGQGIVNHLVEKSLMLEWNDDQILDALVENGRFDAIAGIGQLGNARNAITLQAQKMLVNMSPQAATDLARDIMVGRQTAEGVDAMLRQRALDKFPHLADYIAQGSNPSDFFADHRAVISRMTGVDEDSINLLDDPRYNQIIQYNDAGTIRPMTVHETTTLARGDSRFGNSVQGRGQAASLGRALVEGMGGNF